MRVHLVIIVLLAACAAPHPASKQTPQRIVTLAPNVTEMVIALGAGDRIAGTDDFSADAMPTRKLPRVGGLQPNLEKIVSSAPMRSATIPESRLPIGCIPMMATE